MTAPALSAAQAGFVVAILATTCIMFFAMRAVSGGVDAWANQAVRLVNLSALALLAFAMSTHRTGLTPERAVLVAASLSVLCSGLVCTLENDTVNTAVGAIAVTLGTASFVPWSMRDQALLVLCACVAVLGNQLLLGVHGPVETITASTAIVTFVATIFITRTLEQSRATAADEALRRRHAEVELRRANEKLEQHVQQRSSEARAATEELRAFTYSVFHDLRSPLRTIDGMTRMLEDEHAAQLDDSAMAYMARVKTAARRMDQLIDALLGRSRVGQSPLRRTGLDLTALADTVIEDLERAEPGRRVRWVRPKRIDVAADRTLSAVLLQHLIGNAWKFTRARNDARIELGLNRSGGTAEFFVRDNGHGFAMADSGKLFENFQRLHGEDYEGTGIGLATVRSIVERHGGSVRIESTPHSGTTVYFRLAAC